MFWQSVLGGFGMFAHWQTYVGLVVLAAGAIILLVINFAPMLLAGKGTPGAIGALSGCLFGSVLRFAISAALLAFVVVWLLPLMLGSEQATPFEFLGKGFHSIAISGLLAAVAALVISFIPVIGSIISDVPGASEFVQGVIVVRILLRLVATENGVPDVAVAAAVPSLWTTACFFAIAAAVGLLGFLIASVFQEKIMERFGLYTFHGEENPPLFLATMFGTVAAMLPLFMYVHHIGLSLRAG